MKVACLFSGGKDSTYALFLAQKKYQVRCLITMKSKNPESYMFHFPNINLTKKQAKSLQLPIIIGTTSGEKEKELKDLEKAISKAKKIYQIQGLVSGALASNYQKSRIEILCKKLKIKSITPIWHINPEQYIKSLIKNKFKIIITGIAADGLDESWLGRKIDKKCLDDLKKLNKKFNIHLGFEGGEMESFVLDGPNFKFPIKIKKSEKIMHTKNSGFYKIYI